MIVEHQGRTPTIADDVYVAPTAVVSGDVTIGPGSRILFGAVLTSEGAPVRIGERCVVMENAVIRGRTGYPAQLGDHVLVGPHAHVNGAVVEDNAFLATGAAVFPGARVGHGAEVRIHGVVHVNSRVVPDGLVPIGWVAVGDPAEVLPTRDHDRIWAIQKGLDFPGTVFGLARGPASKLMPEVTRRYAELFGTHRDDREIHPEPPQG